MKIPLWLLKTYIRFEELHVLQLWVQTRGRLFVCQSSELGQDKNQSQFMFSNLSFWPWTPCLLPVPSTTTFLPWWKQSAQIVTNCLLCTAKYSWMVQIIQECLFLILKLIFRYPKRFQICSHPGILINPWIPVQKHTSFRKWFQT